MHWNDFLQSNGAQIKNNNVVNFGQPEIESEATLNGNIITDLSQLPAQQEDVATIPGERQFHLHTKPLKQLTRYRVVQTPDPAHAARQLTQ